MQLTNYLKETSISLELSGKNKQEILSSLVDVLEQDHKIKDRNQIIDSLLERERLGTTGIGHGVAIPHCKSSMVKELCVIIGRSTEEVDFQSLDGNPVQLFFLLVAPEDSTSEHLRALAKIARLAKDSSIRDKLLEIGSNEEFFKFLKEQDANFP